MFLWITFSVLTAIVLAVLLLPLKRPRHADAPRSSYDLNVYRDQLNELARDEAAGLISSSEAQGARNEVARRILSTEQAGKVELSDKAGQNQWPAFAGAVLIPIVTVTGYLLTGMPEYRDVPRAERIANAVKSNDFPALIAQVESHLAADPNDVQGWLVLAPAYRRQGRFDDAAAAFARAIELGNGDAKLYTEYGETLVLANNGAVSAQAGKAFKDALALDGRNAKARFYQAMALAQGGNKQAALSAFGALLADAPADAPWREAVERQISALESDPKVPALDKDQVASAQEMSADERKQMIRGMVDGLARKLADNGDDLEGWLRLINARMVLGEKDKAVEAVKTARRQFEVDETALAKIAAVANKFGLD